MKEEYAWHDYDRALSTAEKNYIYLVLPLDVGEDSVSVEEFLERVWARPLTTPDLVQFCEEFRLWVREGMPL